MKSLSLCLGLVLALASGLPLLASPTATNFRSVGPNLFPAKNDWVARAGTAILNTDTLKLAAATTASYQKTLSVDPGAEYFFAVDVLSPDRVVASLGGLSISYHTQGTRQTVCGLVRPNQKGQLDLTISLRSLKADQSASAELRNFRLQKVERPLVVISKPRDGNTVLVQAGAAQSSIVYPGATKDGKQQAEAIQSVIQTQSGVVVPIISDTAATENNAPILKKELREQNLIVIGRLATNRALWSAYNRFLAAEDGYYPGGDGFAVRTAADVFGNGKNHIILGGSSEIGVQKAVDQFIKTLNPPDTAPRKTIELPWQLDVELGGKCLEAFQTDQKVWQNPDNPLLAAMTPGYGKVVRWYQNAMGYYWSGLGDYRERAQDYLKMVLSDRSYTHQYIVEFFIRAFEMLDESPFFTKDEVSQLDSLILGNFLDFLTVTDLSWMTTFSPPYTEISITNRHQIAPWYADLIMARFLKHHLELGGELKELVEFRLSEKDSAFRAFVSSRNGPSLPGIAGSTDYGEFPATFYRYALENDLYREFFESGLAKQTLSLDRFDHTTATYSFPASEVDLPDMLGTLAHLTHDGTYRWLAEAINHPKPERGPFQGRYVADVHHYHVGKDLSLVEPDASWAGIQIVAQPEIADQTEKKTYQHFPLVSFRGGFEPTDDYLAIAGVNPQFPAGVLVRMVINGQSVFRAVGSEIGGNFSRIITNGASALNLSNYDPEREKQLPAAASIDWKAELSGGWGLQIQTPISADVIWRRDVVRLAGDRYVFADTFTAKRDAKYLLRVAWHGSTFMTPEQEGWKIITNKGTTSIAALGDGFVPRVTGSSLFLEATRTMKAGDSATTWTLIQGAPKNSPLWMASLDGPGQLLLQQTPGQRTILHCGPLETEKGPLISDLIVSSGSDISLFGWRKSPDAASQSFSPSGENAVDGKSTENSLNAAWIPVIMAALTDPKNITSASSNSQPASQKLSADISSLWAKDWSYDGLLRPARVRPTISVDGVVDFGKVVSLNEIRSSTTQLRLWNTTTIPNDLKYTLATDPIPLQSDSTRWLPLSGDHKNRPGVKTGNYGEIHPLPQVDESLFLKDINVRYLKSADAAKLKFYVNDTLEARHPVRVRVLRDLPGEKAPIIVANTNIFPAFPRPIRDDDFSLSLLTPEGKTLSALNLTGPVQSFLVADQNGSGHPQVLVLKADGKLDYFSLEGHPLSSIDLFEQLVTFDKTYGNPNTRQPTGGGRLPFSLGLWRKDGKGASKIVIGRYGTFSFLDQKGNFEGTLIGGPYANVGFLTKSYDFSGTGKEETLALERCNMVQIGGDSTPVIRDPQAFNHWPEVYKVESQKLTKDSETELLSGPPIYEFRILEQFGGRPRYAIVARSNYVGLYDAKEKQWISSWAPPGPIQAAALILETHDKITVSVATVDGILWNLNWDPQHLAQPRIEIHPLGLNVTDMSASPALDGTTLISADDGLYLLKDDGTFARIANGNFRSVDFVTPTKGNRQVVAADILGKISSYRESKIQ